MGKHTNGDTKGKYTQDKCRHKGQFKMGSQMNIQRNKEMKIQTNENTEGFKVGHNVDTQMNNEHTHAMFKVNKKSSLLSRVYGLTFNLFN